VAWACLYEQVRIPALERDFALDVFNKLHVMEMKEAFKEATAGRSEEELYIKMAKTMLSLPDTSMKDFINAEQAAERLRDGFSGYFKHYDVLLTHVLTNSGASTWCQPIYNRRSTSRRDLFTGGDRSIEHHRFTGYRDALWYQ
jgi:hypothetical protein